MIGLPWMDNLTNMTLQILQGGTVTLKLFCITLALSIPLGLVIALMRISKWRALSWGVNCYIWLMRGTPLMLQLLFWCYGLPFVPVIGSALVLDSFNAAIVAFVMNYAAYFAEIFRGGILSVNRGQYEAAQTLGFNYVQTMRRIVLPQMIKRVLPPVSNEVMTLVKDTALIYILAIGEIMYVSKYIVTTNFTPVPFVIAGVIYLFIALILTWFFQRLEKRYAVYED